MTAPPHGIQDRLLSPPITDQLGRTFRDLRLSVTARCNLSCTYCIPESGSHAGNRSLRPEEYVERILRIHAESPLRSLRITGGEPTLYRHLPELIKGIKQAGIPAVHMTSNGLLLAPVVQSLRTAGLDRLNISLDAIDPEILRRIGRSPRADRVFAGIDATQQAGLPLKLNSTIYRGLNENQIVPLFKYAAARGITIRFLELMNMGHLHNSVSDYLVREPEILERISTVTAFRALPRAEASTARYFETPTGARFGIIANHSAPFCGDCDRLRMDAGGRLYGCLSEDYGLEFPQAMGNTLADREQVRRALRSLLAQKQPVRFRGSTLSMKSIGG
ncbi:MAG: radical SAM protein [Leptospiraceae bacterium]|nr:radical SAM protein [Leptospiraceae bacterium]